MEAPAHGGEDQRATDEGGQCADRVDDDEPVAQGAKVARVVIFRNQDGRDPILRLR